MPSVESILKSLDYNARRNPRLSYKVESDDVKIFYRTASERKHYATLALDDPVDSEILHYKLGLTSGEWSRTPESFRRSMRIVHHHAGDFDAGERPTPVRDLPSRSELEESVEKQLLF